MDINRIQNWSGNSPTPNSKIQKKIKIDRTPQRQTNLTSHEAAVKRAQLFKRYGHSRKLNIIFSLFRLYDSREFPVRILHCSPFNRLTWDCPLHLTLHAAADPNDATKHNGVDDNKRVDFFRLLPLFLAGVLCAEDPYRFIAVQGTSDLLDAVPQEELTEELVKEIASGMKSQKSVDSNILIESIE